MTTRPPPRDVVLAHGAADLRPGARCYYRLEAEEEIARRAHLEGGSIMGSRAGLRCILVPSIGPVLPLSAVSHHLQDETCTLAELVEELRGLESVCGVRVRSAGAAALALARIEEPPILIPMDATPDARRHIASSVHAGPVEWWRVVRSERVTYLDQTRAYLWGLEQGIPDGRWTWLGDDRDALLRVLDHPERWCVVADVVAELDAPALPRRAGRQGPTYHEVGRVRTIVRGPHLIGAERTGGEIARCYGAWIARRRTPTRLIQAIRSRLDATDLGHYDPATARGAKAIYQRLWGKLAGQAGSIGRPIVGTYDATQGRRSIVHGLVWQWSSGAPDPYRPDIAGEIVSAVAARTLQRAIDIETVAPGSVAMLHVDSVLARGDHVPGPGWTIKGQGRGHVLGHGRYWIEGDPKPVVGRAGLEDEDPWEVEAPHEGRRWLAGMVSEPRKARGDEYFYLEEDDAA